MIKSNLPLAIIGLGKTGKSIAKYLNKINCDFIVYDTRKDLEITKEIKKEINENKIILGEFKEEYIENHDNFIVSPGIKLEKNIIEKIKISKKNIQTDIDIFNGKKRKNVICITGTNGKTTVTLLIEHILKNLGNKVKAGANVGLPVLELLSEDYEYNILELSSFQLEMTKTINSKISLITNITPDHLDRHENFENYVILKNKIFNNAEISIFNRLDNNINSKATEERYTFGADVGQSLNDFGIIKENNINYISQGKKKIISENDVQLIGKHNFINICAALAVIKALKLDVELAAQTIKKFGCVEHRMENFLKNDNISWINDSKSTNIDSTISAIKSLDKNIVLLMGGRSKTNDYSELEKVLKNKVDKIIFFGESKNFLKNALKSVKDISIANNMEHAVCEAINFINIKKENCEENMYIILSPACSSYDMYKSFEERGKSFKNHAINQYK
jgi:UDP-N-acetylmuramoylalanine--D-glutamate ligase